MNIERLFEKLSYGELSNLSMSVEGSGTIDENAQPRILNFANEGLSSLFSQFNLLEKQLVLELREGISNYQLKSEFAYSKHDSNSENDWFILDSDDEPFLDDIILITEVMASNGDSLPINDPSCPESVFTPQEKLLQVPRILLGSALSVKYRANHPLLTMEDLTQEILLPLVLEKALTSWIAYNVYSSMNGPENSSKAQEYMSMFTSICNNAESMNLVNNSSGSSNSRFVRGGWV